MEERKKYEFLVFLTIYVVFMFLMLPVGVKAPRIFIAFLEGRYGEIVRPAPVEPEQPPAPAAPLIVRVLVVVGGAAILSLGVYGGRQAYLKLTARDYRVTRQERAECTGTLIQRPRCRHYRPTPSTECAHFLGYGDEGMCVRDAPARRAPGKPSARPRAGRG